MRDIGKPLPPQVPHHHCRNARCGTALKVPVDNPRDAFCCSCRAIERCIAEADEASWFAEHPERKYYLRPACAAEIEHRCTLIPETAIPLAPGCRSFLNQVRADVRREMRSGEEAEP
jgi:hypothetical protein